MNLDLVFKIAGIGIIISVLNMVMKQAGKEEHGYIITLVGVVVVLGMVLGVIRDLFDTVRAMFQLY
ncbi:MAG TPA: stage III sporulation protein AC [Clostridia bacterium]|nr:stage III sporulation protein AC [Clostridia bacterium]